MFKYTRKIVAGLLAIQCLSLVAFWFIGSVHIEQMMQIKPWLGVEVRIALYIVMIAGLLVMLNKNILLGFMVVVIVDAFLFINQMSINKGIILNFILSFWDAAILMAALMLDSLQIKASRIK